MQYLVTVKLGVMCLIWDSGVRHVDNMAYSPEWVECDHSHNGGDFGVGEVTDLGLQVLLGNLVYYAEGSLVIPRCTLMPILSSAISKA